MKNKDNKVIIEGTGDNPELNVSYYVLYFRDLYDNVERIAFPLDEMANGPAAILKELSRKNFQVPFGTKERANLINSLQAQMHLLKKKFLVTTKLGWLEHEGKYVYALPEKFYPQNKLLVLQPDKAIAKYKTLGTLEDWHNNVATYATGNSFMIFSILVPFAALLLNFFPDKESGGFQFVGQSSQGKTTLLAIAGSVCGGDDRGKYIDSWLGTANSLDITAQAHCDNLLCLDETGLVAKEKRIVLDAAYRLANGIGKARYVNSSNHLTWRILMLSSSEESMKEMAESVGDKLKDGQAVRIVDIIADAGCGMGVFENLHGCKTPKEFSEMLKAQTSKYSGAALDAYLTKLVPAVNRDIDKLKQTLNDRMNYYIRKSSLPGDSATEGRIASRFALNYAAGCLAAKFGILPWTKKEIFAAVHSCHKRIAFRSENPMPEPEEAVIRLRQYILENEKRFIILDENSGPFTESSFLEANGFIYGKGKKKEYLFPTKSFGKICLNLPVHEVVKYLISEHLVNRTKDGKSSVQRQFPGLGSKRVISIKCAINDELQRVATIVASEKKRR